MPEDFDLKRYIMEGRAVLILGQDYLKWLNTNLNNYVEPLLRELKQDVSKTVISEGFFAVCLRLVDRGVPIETLSDVLQKILGSIPLTDELRLIAKTPWRAIFTTAVDDGLGRALRETPTRFVRNVYEKNRRLVDPRDENNLYIIRLLGALDQVSPERMPSFAAPTERRRTIRSLLDHLDEIAGVDDAIVVIAGFDPVREDQWVSGQIWERIEELAQNAPSYWFQKGVDRSGNRILTDLIAEQKLKIVEDSDLPEFLGVFENEISMHQENPGERTLMTRYGQVTIPETQWRVYKQHMVILSANAIATPLPSFKNADDRYEYFRDFLKAENHPDWAGHTAGFVFERPVMKSVEALAEKMLKHGRSKHNSVITVSGPSGSGKTFVLEHVAWRLAKGGNPVVYLPKTSQPLDFKVIDSFCQAVQPKRELEKGAESAVRTVVVWDSLASDPNRYNSLASYLTSQGRPALIIGASFAPSRTAARANDDLMDSSTGEPFRVYDLPVPIKLESGESGEFVEYLRGVDAELLTYLNETSFTETLEEDFLVALYDHIPALRNQIARGARVQYRTYEELLRPRIEVLFGGFKKQWKDLLPLVFIPSQFGCYPNLELILDSLGEGYRDLWLKEDKSELLMEGLLYEDRQSGILRLRARNARIAKISITGRYAPEDQVKYLRRLARAVRPAFPTELNFLREVFHAIRGMARDDARMQHSYSSFLPFQEDLAGILTEFREKEEDPTLMHTEAILLRRSASRKSKEIGFDYNHLVGIFSSAIETLERAVEILGRDNEFTRPIAEIQNIANSIAASYRDLIKLRLNYLTDHPDEDHSELRNTIEEEQIRLMTYCDLAARGAFPNTFEVDVYVTNLLNRYQHDIGATDEEKEQWAVEMIEELDRSQQSFADSDLTTILNTRVLVEDSLSEFTNQRRTIEELQRRGSLSGFYLAARSAAYRYDRRSHRYVPRNVGGLKRGIELLKELNPSALLENVSCLALYNRLWWDINAPDSIVGQKRDLTVSLSVSQWSEYKELLEQQMLIERERGARTMFLRFMLAWSHLQIGDSSGALRLLRELDNESTGSRFRVASLVRLSNEDGSPRRFTGDVIEPRDDRTGIVYCSPLRIHIPFRLFAFEHGPKIGDPLDFEIMINYRGLLASPFK